jgi:hypothetical protein
VSEQVLETLRATPVRLAELSDGLPEARLHAAPEPDAWSARDVLAHLRACADVWGGAMARLLDEDRPTFRAVSPRTWISGTDYLAQPFRASLGAFSGQRAELLALLEPLSPAQWTRTATVTGAGRPLTPTVLSYAERMATHERSHVRQVARLLG